MHWIDPAQLTAIEGVIERFLCNAHGELDGLILIDGTEVHFPPHLSEAVRGTFKPAMSIRIRGLRPRRAPLLAPVALEAVKSGRTIIDNGPNGDARRKEPRRTLEASGKVVRTLHGPKGESRGALLDDGTIVHLGKHAEPSAMKFLAPGCKLAARGEGVDGATGRCLEVRFIGSSSTDLRPLDRKPEKKAAREPLIR
jgi:hypothetical protein